MISEYRTALTICLLHLGDPSSSPTIVEIKRVAKDPFIQKRFPNVDSKELLAELKSFYTVEYFDSKELVRRDIKPWIGGMKSSIEWELWERYTEYLKNENPTFPILKLDDYTDRILDKCPNPKEKGPWDCRGMVVGNVQSGKTANYIGLINKATDVGYKMIIVIAGVQNTLRAQTQLRIDQGYIGRDSADFIEKNKRKVIGVGKTKAKKVVYSYTSSVSNGDFNKNIATRLNVPIHGESPTVVVIKKNKSILENLILWLEGFAQANGYVDPKIVDVPLLVIDDEADNASVNSGTQLDVKTINRLIRTLLNLFTRSCYIGYTATPYANLFIPADWSDDLRTDINGSDLLVGEDLFPRDFIINIPAPSNHFGGPQLFGLKHTYLGGYSEGLNLIRMVNDGSPYFPQKINRENEKKLPTELPLSLKEAIQTFILTCAIRRVRDQKKSHNSMLIHVSLRVKWIDRIARLVDEIVRDYIRQIKSKQGQLLQNIKRLFKEDFIKTTVSVLENMSYEDRRIKKHNWAEVERELYHAASKIDVRAVHGEKRIQNLEYDKIQEINYRDYEKGLSVIAVGGNKLSRGITLEGLSVSYFLRTSRMYDSLMQMGRWFGYRPGYVDLCRLYTTDTLASWFQHITLATEEMKNDFDEMALNNKSPKDYQLKVKKHPGMLSITSISKMRGHETLKVGFSGQTIQTHEFQNSVKTVETNYEVFKDLISHLNTPETKKTKSGSMNALLWKDVGVELIQKFLNKYQSTLRLRKKQLSDYIQKQNKNGNLKSWPVALILTSKKHTMIKKEKIPLPTQKVLFEWNGGKKNGGIPYRKLCIRNGKLFVKGNKNAILGPNDRKIDLDIDAKKEDQIIKTRKRLNQPLLAILPIDSRISESLNPNIPIIGFGLIFPQLENEEVVEYAARPLCEDFENISQEDDDRSEYEN